LSKTHDRALRDAALKFFKAKVWSDPFAVTLTLKNARREGEYWIGRKDGDAQRNLGHFLNVLRKKFERRGLSKTKGLQCVPVLEGNDDVREHLHLIIDKPACVGIEEFHALISAEWSRTHWGHARVDIRPCYDTEGCLKYYLKLCTKSDYAAAIDWTNVR
jgi:hypothetical protein